MFELVFSEKIIGYQTSPNRIVNASFPRLTPPHFASPANHRLQSGTLFASFAGKSLEYFF
jgi:hypothetical protein